jgi:hypothetical protein
MHGFALPMIVVSAVSALSSMTILLHFLFSPALRHKYFFKAMAYIAFSNLITSLGSMMGEPHDESAACWFMGIGTNVFTLSATFWFVVLSLMVYYIGVQGKVVTFTWHVHLICWGAPIAVTLLPLAFNMRYGSIPHGGEWCFVVCSNENEKGTCSDLVYWYFASYYLWMWASLLSMIWILALTFIRRRNTVNKEKQKLLSLILRTVRWLPAAVFLAWGPATLSDVIFSVRLGVDAMDYGSVFDKTTTLLACSQGFIFAVLYWSNSEIRKLMISYSDSELSSMFRPIALTRRHSRYMCFNWNSVKVRPRKQSEQPKLLVLQAKEKPVSQSNREKTPRSSTFTNIIEQLEDVND